MENVLRGKERTRWRVIPCHLSLPLFHHPSSSVFTCWLSLDLIVPLSLSLSLLRSEIWERIALFVSLSCFSLAVAQCRKRGGEFHWEGKIHPSFAPFPQPVTSPSTTLSFSSTTTNNKPQLVYACIFPFFFSLYSCSSEGFNGWW